MPLAVKGKPSWLQTPATNKQDFAQKEIPPDALHIATEGCDILLQMIAE